MVRFASERKRLLVDLPAKALRPPMRAFQRGRPVSSPWYVGEVAEAPDRQELLTALTTEHFTLAAALGVLVVLAQGRQADLAERRPDRGREQAAAVDAMTRIGSAEALARRLGIAAEHVLPAFEDPAERMLKEGALPANVDPSDPKIDDPIERARIMREFERHLGAGRLCAADAALDREGERRLDQRNLADAPPPAVPDAGRFADRFPPAAQVAAACRAGRRAASGAGRSVRRRAARCPIRAMSRGVAASRAFAAPPPMAPVRRRSAGARRARRATSVKPVRCAPH